MIHLGLKLMDSKLGAADFCHRNYGEQHDDRLHFNYKFNPEMCAKLGLYSLHYARSTVQLIR